jgi:transposase
LKIRGTLYRPSKDAPRAVETYARDTRLAFPDLVLALNSAADSDIFRGIRDALQREQFSKTAVSGPFRYAPPVLISVTPLSPGRAERHGFEYYRHGTLSLFAALNTQSGEVIGQTVPRHTSAAFVEFLGNVVASQPKGREIHVIADNLSTHKTQAVRTFLLEHPNVRLHFTPTYSSWLNQVELWFSKIERDLLARGIFTSVADLARKIRRYIRLYNKAPKPIRWAYRNPAHRISSTSASTGH